jgi:hypothetical protein
VNPSLTIHPGIVAATSDIDNRYSFAGIGIRRHGERSQAVATDGRILAVSYGTADPDAPTDWKMVPVKKGNRSRFSGKADIGVCTSGGSLAVCRRDRKAWTSPEAVESREGSLPPWEHVLPTRRLADDSATGGGTVLIVNAQLLARLAEAIGGPDSTGHVALVIPSPKRSGGVPTEPVVVIPSGLSDDGDGSFGLIMPINTDRERPASHYRDLAAKVMRDAVKVSASAPQAVSA